MNSVEFLRIRRSLSEKETECFEEISDQFRLLSGKAVTEKFVMQVLDLLHDALKTNSLKFIQDLFFEFEQSISKTKRNKRRVYQTMSKGFGKCTLEEEQLELVNLYRSIVAELFDPYLSLIIASLKFREGNYVSFVDANLGMAENSKYEFAFAWLGPTKLFDGYNRIVRNAISHAGTDSIVLDGDTIIFKNISRNTLLKVETEVWNTEKLYEKIMSLLDMIHSISIAVDIFGIDIGDIIKGNEDLETAFIRDILEREDRMEIQEGFANMIDSVWKSDASDGEKKKVMTDLFFVACRQRTMPVKGVRFNTVDRIVLIDVPAGNLSMADDSGVQKRVTELLRYGVIGEPCFRPLAGMFFIEEIKIENAGQLKVRLTSELLRDYGSEQAGILDMLQEAEIYLNNQRIRLEVDFQKVRELEYANLGKNYPRKKR